MKRLPLLLAAALALGACSSSAPDAPLGGGSLGAPAAAPTGAATASTTPPQLVPYVPGEDPDGDAEYQAGIEAYNQAEFELAAQRFDALARRESAPRPLRREAYRFLGRTQVALGDEMAASATLRRLVELEPPIVELDPDVEPPPLIEAYYAVRRDLDGGYDIRTERPQTLAVADFTNSSITEHDAMQPLSQGFASLMLHAMRGSTELRLVERERLQWLLDEQSLPTSESGAQQASELLGADRVVFGFYIRSGRDLTLGARVVDVETSEILLSEQVEGRADRFSDLLESLTTKVAQSINVSLARVNVETNSLDAALAYSEGLALIESGDYRGAHAKFERALQADPSYARARTKAESLRPMLASN